MATNRTFLFTKGIITNFFAILTLCLIHSPFITTDKTSLPRGVALSRKALYDPGRDFTCLDESSVIPFKYVNDDYCDCNDGSDEPGTSACINGIFYCDNAGYKHLNIPTSRVNDGICDCCDGTDEYNSSATCVDNCKELGRQAYEADQMRLAIFRKGYEIKQDYIKKGKQLKVARQNKLKELEEEFNVLNLIKEEKEAVKISKEELEKIAVDKFNLKEEEKKRLIQEKQDIENDERLLISAFTNLDLDQNGKITLDEIKDHWMFDLDKDGSVTDEEARYYLANKEEMELEKFKVESWPLIKPPYSLSQTFSSSEVISHQENVVEIKEGSVVGEEISTKQMNNVAAADTDNGVVEDDDEKTQNSDEIKGDIPEAPEEEKPNYDEVTQALVNDAENARKDFQEAESKAKEAEKILEKANRILSIDFGPNEEFGSLLEHCFDHTHHEYTYTLCFFGRATQKPDENTGINLGDWSKWEGDNNNKFSKMIYENGLDCWNGPSRSTEVRLSCGTTNQLLKVSEPEKCKYLMDAITPAACFEPSKQADSLAREEL